VLDSDVDAVRRLYAAFAAGDMDAARACLAVDVVWHVPGRSQIAGDYYGFEDIRHRFWDRLRLLTSGTFAVEALDLLVGENYVVGLQRATGERGGRRLDVVIALLMRVLDGRISELRGFLFDAYAFDAFFDDGVAPWAAV
jgi:uncharacterized protein